MKKLSMILAALGCLSIAAPVVSTPASAYVVRKTVRTYGYHRPVVRGYRGGVGCRTVTTRSYGRVVTKRVCR